MPATALIAIDWGTTSARAYCLDARGKVVAERSVPLGVLQVQDGCFPEALGVLLGDWHDVAAPRLACGMVGSRQGWREAPYVDCPAPLASLAAGIVRTEGGALAIVPGVCTRDSNGIPDVMRGEDARPILPLNSCEFVSIGQVSLVVGQGSVITSRSVW